MLWLRQLKIINILKKLFMVRVASASSLFQEKGLDARGIFTLMVNAVERENLSITYLANPGSDYENTLNPSSVRFKDCRPSAINALLREVNEFKPDLVWAKKRITQFFVDHAKIKDLGTMMSQIGFWEMLFKRRKEYRALAHEKAEIENMSLSLQQLINVAFCRYHQATGKQASVFITELKAYLEEENEKYL